jgi:pimeloyl-ACP methyl ester carboxylesterase
VASLKDYAGPIDIFGAIDDAIIPIEHARALARQIPKAHFVEITGGHNDWSENEKVRITR